MAHGEIRDSPLHIACENGHDNTKIFTGQWCEHQYV